MQPTIRAILAPLVPAILLLLQSALCHAQDASPCSGFAWPLEKELALMSAPNVPSIENGAKAIQAPATAVSLALQPTKSVTLPLQAGIKRKALGADTFSGWFEVAGVAVPGLYQVALSHDAWIDVAQNGEVIQSTGFTGKRDCAAVRKSVRFPIAAGPLVIQISGAPLDKIKLSITPAPTQ